MNNAKTIKDYIAKAKSLAINVQYNRMELTEHIISRRVLNGLSLTYSPEKRKFALRTDFSLGDLEGGLVRVEELNKSLGRNRRQSCPNSWFQSQKRGPERAESGPERAQ